MSLCWAGPDRPFDQLYPWIRHRTCNPLWHQHHPEPNWVSMLTTERTDARMPRSHWSISYLHNSWQPILWAGRICLSFLVLALPGSYQSLHPCLVHSTSSINCCKGLLREPERNAIQRLSFNQMGSYRGRRGFHFQHHSRNAFVARSSWIILI